MDNQARRSAEKKKTLMMDNLPKAASQVYPVCYQQMLSHTYESVKIFSGYL